MAAPGGIPVDVVRFVTENIDSLEQLELLAMLMESPDRWWDADSAGLGLRIAANQARGNLERLATRNLLAISVTTAVRYRFEPGRPGLRETSEAFADAYRRNPQAVVRVVTDGQQRAIRDFANAFRIRPHDDR